MATDTSIPVVVLVNGGTASASEIVAAALQGNDRGQLVGETTFGKGTIQEFKELPGAGGYRLSVRKWLTPDQTWIHGVGLTPDVEADAAGRARAGPGPGARPRHRGRALRHARRHISADSTPSPATIALDAGARRRRVMLSCCWERKEVMCSVRSVSAAPPPGSRSPELTPGSGASRPRGAGPLGPAFVCPASNVFSPRIVPIWSNPLSETVAVNRKARHNYTISDTFEAGLVLTGTEIKSIRAGKANLSDAYARVEKGEAWLMNAHIAPFEQGNRYNHEPRRDRKLLLRRTEIDQLMGRGRGQGPDRRAAAAVHQRQGPRQDRARPGARASSSTTVAATSPTARRDATWNASWPTRHAAAADL